MSTAQLASVDPWLAVTWAVRTTWRELPRMLGVSVAWVIVAVPAAVALSTAPPVIVALALLPLAIATTWTFEVLARAAADGPIRFLRRRSVDLALAFACWAWIVGTWWLAGLGSGGAIAASLLGAVGVLVLPTSLAYGAVRRRRGIGALRGGIVIAVLRPGLAVSLAGVVCLAAFACIATAGTLLLVAPAFVALVGCRLVRSLFRAG